MNHPTIRTPLIILLVHLATGCGCSDTGLQGVRDADTGEGTPVEDGWSTDTAPGDGPTTTDMSWDHPMEAMGDPGWRDSVEPVCREDRMVFSAVGLWSDERAVFVMLDSMSGMTEGSLIWNSGTGWSEIARMGDVDGPSDRLTGFPDGDVIAYAAYAGMAVFSPPDWSRSSEDFYPERVFVVSDDLAYATLDRDPRLAMFDGSSWGPFPGEPLPYSGHLVWADETSVFVAGESGMVLSYEEDSWIVHDTRTMESFISLWGFAADDVWAGTHGGSLMHYDGLDWSFIEWPDMADDSDLCRMRGGSIEGMWGQDGVLFFHTADQLAMYDGADFSTLAYWAGHEVVDEGLTYCDGGLIIRAMWGNSPTELFIAVEEGERTSTLCEEYIMWWDGSLFHWF